jgi:hypothetical protein
VAAALWLAACAHAPPAAFPVALPAALEAGKPLAVIGDLQLTAGFVRLAMRRESTRDAQAALVSDLAARIDDAAALVIVGDLVFSARSRRDWRHFDELMGPLAARVPLLPAIGNHDYPCILVYVCTDARIAPRFLRRFPWFEPGKPYTVDFGDVALMMLDSETALDAQATWLEQALGERARDSAAALVFIHRPPYTNTSVSGAVGGDVAIQSTIVPVLGAARLPVALVSGHVHGFEHLVVDGVHYVTTAGGGGPRGLLLPDRPGDVYAGPDCAEVDGAVLRPFNYLLVERRPESLAVTVRGLCSADAPAQVLDAFELPVALPPGGAASPPRQAP